MLFRWTSSFYFLERYQWIPLTLRYLSMDLETRDKYVRTYYEIAQWARRKHYTREPMP